VGVLQARARNLGRHFRPTHTAEIGVRNCLDPSLTARVCRMGVPRVT
jgi:hypothetical protein